MGCLSRVFLDFFLGARYMGRMRKNERRLMFDGAKLKEERLRQGYSCEQLAVKLRGVGPKASKQHVWSWERGLCDPTPRFWFALARSLGRPVEYFLKK